jgi:type II secretory pathway component PulF
MLIGMPFLLGGMMKGWIEDGIKLSLNPASHFLMGAETFLSTWGFVLPILVYVMLLFGMEIKAYCKNWIIFREFVYLNLLNRSVVFVNTFRLLIGPGYTAEQITSMLREKGTAEEVVVYKEMEERLHKGEQLSKIIYDTGWPLLVRMSFRNVMEIMPEAKDGVFAGLIESLASERGEALVKLGSKLNLAMLLIVACVVVMMIMGFYLPFMSVTSTIR